MTPGAARVIDPIITQVARGYSPVGNYIAEVLFPIVRVAARAGRIIKFGAEDFRIVNTARAPGANTKRAQFGYESDTFGLIDHSLEALVPVEIQGEAAAVPGLNVVQMSIRKVQNMMMLEREVAASQLATNAANYGAGNKVTLTGTDQWSDDASDPLGDVEDAKEAIRQQIGVRPNVLAVGPKVLNRLRRHPKILDKLSTSTDRTPASLAQLAAFFEVDRVVEGQAVTHDGTSFSDVWGKKALLAFSTPASMQDMGSPSFGYTYQLEGMPIVEESYLDRNAKSLVYPYTDAYKAVLTGATAGFLIDGAVA